ncbi:VVA0879 family protein [Nonomuraea sp. GTA35]|uniref:VVA0879 family protein n=1 Tax=Nonomuraea sp. GTA35 TaxID=1676746 RepID=UPI0035C1C5EC
MSEHRKLTLAEFRVEAAERFGDDTRNWAFTCPNCGDVATGQDFADALAKHPRPSASSARDVRFHDILGQECIGRTLGALYGTANDDQGQGRAERGCDWAAYGLIRGPWEVVSDVGPVIWSFPLADAPVPADTSVPAEVQA